MATEIEQHNGNNGNEGNNGSNSNIKPELQAIAASVDRVAVALERIATEIANGFQIQAAALVGIKPPPATPEKRSFDVA